ncbi:Helix-turn-helix domain protein [Planctomycetes bacterium Pla163]|uniref:Helix-turn-helix domain protein n=1 Tax=Rohdeia mirabilis TaxID=2528008 RepID=A0A518CYE7_9BACT|nr:Helix-turn-helix domain protein [Planctomycetes bacterium Pla163]
MSGSRDPEILNIEEAAKLLGVSVKTFNKVLHSQELPARKIGREWKFSRQALIDWVGSGRSADFYRDAASEERATESSAAKVDDSGVIRPAERRTERTTETPVRGRTSAPTTES